MAEPEELLQDEPGAEEREYELTQEFAGNDFDDAPEFELEEEFEVHGSYTDDILNAEQARHDIALVGTDENPKVEEPSAEIATDETQTFELQEDLTEAPPTPAETTSTVEQIYPDRSAPAELNILSNEETESIELLLSDSDEEPGIDGSDETPTEPQSVEKIDTEVVELQHSLKSLHQQQVHQLEMSLLERIDDLIHILEKRNKNTHSPEQLPHKQFATGLHYISNEKNHYLGGKWLRKAAMQGHGKAQLYLGMLFVQGNGVPKSLFHAYAWFSLAVCQNIEEAKDARKKLEPYLTAKEINSSLRYAADLLDKIHHM